MEYGVFGLPKPDLVVLLDVPFKVSKMWLENKITQRSKKYLQGKKDVAEENLRHLKVSRDCALSLASENKNWEKVSCCEGMVCMSLEEVHEEVFRIFKRRIK